MSVDDLCFKKKTLSRTNCKLKNTKRKNQTILNTDILKQQRAVLPMNSFIHNIVIQDNVKRRKKQNKTKSMNYINAKFNPFEITK